MSTMRIRSSLIAVALAMLLSSLGSRSAHAEETRELLTDAGPATKPKYTNRLAKEKSPYLLQHAHNPVDWYPWGQEAFDKAKKENKPIFLSVGYSTCHWCHVMEREAFSDESVAKLLNEKFVPIKVDREERPDVDRVYMTYLTASTGSGGWPMNVFLTSDLKPFFGGTYFPVEDKGGLPGIKRVLTKIADAWANDRKSVEDAANDATKQLGQLTQINAEQGAAVERQLLDRAYQGFAKRFDATNGGFGTAPKFPTPVELNFLLTYYHRTARLSSPKSGDAAALDMVLKTLDAMAAGGIRDHIGGGFHRYSTDERWFLPHFEKMLYDQAQIAGVYLDAYQVTGESKYADVAQDIFEYVLRDLTSPEGRFYSAEDADSALDPSKPDEKAEGAFYVWSLAELQQALGADAAKLFAFHFGVQPGGNVARDPQKEFTNKNVLFASHSIAETAKQFGKSEADVSAALADARVKLLAVRGNRPRPHLDDKTIVAWNALMISSLARGGIILHESRYSAAAIQAAAFIRDRLYDAKSHELSRVYRDGPSPVAGFLEDYAFFIESLIDVYEATLDVQWLRLALDLQSTQDRLFGDEQSGGYFSTRATDANLLLRLKEDSDNVEPAGNSVAARNLLRLAQMTDDKKLADRADKTIKLYAGTLQRSPAAMPRMLVAIDFHQGKPKQIVLAGDPNAPETRAMLEAVYTPFLPNRVILGADQSAGQAFLAGHLDFIRDIKPLNGKATAYVCENYACQRPTTDISELAKQLSPPRNTTSAEER
jgi:uncharacterized protein YyaL (SSP411 family)